MSWFKRLPRAKEHSIQHPKNSSPFAEKILKETKAAVTATEPIKKKPNKAKTK